MRLMLLVSFPGSARKVTDRAGQWQIRPDISGSSGLGHHAGCPVARERVLLPPVGRQQGGFRMPGGFWYYAQEDPDALAVVDPDGTEITAGELLARCNRMAH